MEHIGQVGRGDRFFGETHPDLCTLRLGVKGHRLVVA